MYFQRRTQNEVLVLRDEFGKGPVSESECVYPRPSSRLPVNWAKLVSSRKLRGEEGGDVSHLIVALSTSTGDWKRHKSS